MSGETGPPHDHGEVTEWGVREKWRCRPAVAIGFIAESKVSALVVQREEYYQYGLSRVDSRGD